MCNASMARSEQGARAPKAAPTVDRHRLSRHRGPEDSVYAALDLAGRGSGEVLHGQVNLLQAVASEAGRVMGPLVEVDQQPYATSRERSQSPLRAWVGASEHSGRDPHSLVGQAEERAQGNLRLRQASSARREPLSSGMRQVRHL